MASRIPITIITGFAGSGKTTLILNLLPQLRAENPGYKLALIKNEIGDLNVDSQLAAAAEMTGSQELLGDCICCTNVGQIGDALATLDKECNPDRIIIETSGSAEPLKLVLEVNRLAKESGRYELDGIISVVDAENWYVPNETGNCRMSLISAGVATQTQVSRQSCKLSKQI
jgi:G3E family GTPase